MADIRINQLPTAASPVATLNVPVDGVATEKITIETLVNTGRPLASQAEAEAGVNAVKAMTPLTTKQHIDARMGTDPGTIAAGNDSRIVGAAQKSANLSDLSNIGTAQDNIQVGATFADVTTGEGATIPARNKRIRLQARDASLADRDGASEWRRISLADLTGYPAASYFRSTDRIMPDGTTDATNGGYWLLDEVVIMPAMLGAKKDDATFNSGAAIQAAIDLGNLLKRPVHLPIGTLYTSQTLHIYAQSVLYGYGKSQSVLKWMDSAGIANDQKGVLETYDFSSLTDTATKYVTDPGMTWGFVLKGFAIDGNRTNNYGGVSGTRFGGVGTHVWDGFGMRLYGRRYIVEDISIHDCAGIGFYSECGNPTVSSPSDWYYNALNDQQGHIEDMIVSLCSYDGFVFRGPGDIFISDVTTFLCNYPDETLYGTARASLMFPSDSIAGMVWADKTVTGGSVVAGCEIGFVHSHTNKNGYGIRFEGNVTLRLRTDNLVSEGSLGGIKVRGRVWGQWNHVNLRNHSIGDGTLPHFDVEVTNNEVLMINDVEVRCATGDVGATKIRVGSDRVQFGSVMIRGGVAGHGVVLESNVDSVLINQLFVTDLRGNAQDGNASRALWTKSGVDLCYIGEVILLDNQVGWRNDSSAEVVVAKGRISSNAVTYPGIVPLNLATSPSATSLRQCGFSTFDGTSTKYPTFSGNASVDPTSITEQTLTWTHNMWRTPNLNEVSWGYVTNGTNRPTLQYAELIAPTSTQLSMRVKFSVAGNGTSGGSAFATKV